MENKDILQLALESSNHAEYGNFDKMLGHKHGFIAGYKAALNSLIVKEYQRLSEKCDEYELLRGNAGTKICGQNCGCTSIEDCQFYNINEVKEDSEDETIKSIIASNLCDVIDACDEFTEFILADLKKEFIITRKVKEEDKPTPLIPDRDLEYFKNKTNG